MKISIVVISTLLVLSVILPVLLFVLNGAKNTSNIKKKINELIKDNGITYDQKDMWRKNFIGLSYSHKTVTYIHFNENKPSINTIALTEVKQCHIVKSMNKNNAKNLEKLGLEFHFKSPLKPKITLIFFDVDNDLTEDFELQRIEKWQTLILNVLPKHEASKKIAS